MIYDDPSLKGFSGCSKGRSRSPRNRINIVSWLIFGADFVLMLAALSLVLPPQSYAVSVLAPHVASAMLMTVFGPYLIVSVSCVPGLILLAVHVVLMGLLVRRERMFEVFGRRARSVRWIALGSLATLAVLSCYYEFPVIEQRTFASDKAVGGPVRLAVISDLHSCVYGNERGSLLRNMNAMNPDAVVFVGDIFDDRLPDDHAQAFITQVVKSSPCFYVSGNHEYWSERVDDMKAWLRSVGVTVLEGECRTLSVGGTAIDICGVDDPTYMSDNQWLRQVKRADEQSDPSRVRILLTHRPEWTSVYERFAFDLVLAGHAHGGQWRIPFTDRGCFAPNQYFFPKYVDGRHTLANGSVMMVCRGLARESTPLPRLFNHPEIILLEVRGR